ncbi:P-loop containing nucleoside triphosphate hydrolase protein, partial [Neocallimastix californiae]
MGPYISTNPFNYVFSNVNSQENVYYQSVHSLVEHFHKGKNSLVLAYGQMGSGKTYTIGFQPEDYSLENFNPDIIGNDLGFVPRAFQETLSYIHLLKSQGRTANLLVTFIAISCEDIADLL